MDDSPWLRINTYTTVPATWKAADEERARAASVVTFGSPSAVRTWVERVGTAAIAVRMRIPIKRIRAPLVAHATSSFQTAT